MPAALSGRTPALQKLYFDLDQIQGRHARTTLNSGLAFGETAGAVDPSSVAVGAGPGATVHVGSER
jgi:hypothetical protein